MIVQFENEAQYIMKPEQIDAVNICHWIKFQTFSLTLKSNLEVAMQMALA